MVSNKRTRENKKIYITYVGFDTDSVTISDTLFCIYKPIIQ